MQLYLVRHSEPQLVPGCCYGRSDLPALEGPLAQTAERLAALLERLHSPCLISSPLRRCRQLAERVGDGVELEARWQELDFGEWEGRPWELIAPEEIDHWNADLLGYRPGGVENMSEMRRRVLAALSERLARAEPQVVVTHAGVIRILLAHWLELSAEQMLRLRLDYGSVTRLEAKGTLWQVHYVNRLL